MKENREKKEITLKEVRKLAIIIGTAAAAIFFTIAMFNDTVELSFNYIVEVAFCSIIIWIIVFVACYFLHPVNERKRFISRFEKENYEAIKEIKYF